MEVAASNAGGRDTLPMPTVVLGDSEGVIRWIHVYPKLHARTSATSARMCAGSVARGVRVRAATATSRATSTRSASGIG
jgi:hypothetical protein